MRRKDIFELAKANLNAAQDKIFLLIENKISSDLGKPFTLSMDVKNKLKVLMSTMRKKWQESWRMETRFLEKNNAWLNEIVVLCEGAMKDILPEQENRGTLTI